MNKEYYQDAEMEIITFDETDIIVTSIGGDEDEGPIVGG